MSEYFTYTNLTPNSLARSSDVNNRFNLVGSGFDMLPSPTKIQQGRVTYALAGGTANALTAALERPIASYEAGLRVTVKLTATNTGTATINVDGVGAKTIKRADGSALSAGELVSGNIVDLIYDGTDFRMVGASELTVAAYASSASTSATNAAASATAAASSASAAATSATSAETSATNAANSATAAAASAASIDPATLMPKAGGTFTGAVTLSGAPTVDLHPATKKYVDDAVFAAGAYSADGTTITLATGQFSLTTVANNTILGNVSGAVAKPGALTATQVTALLNPATTALQGAMSAADKTKLDAFDGANISGNAGTATRWATTRTIEITGPIVAASPKTIDGTNNISLEITALNVDYASSGTLPVARGGTGVTTATGTGSVVLSASPTLTGNVAVPSGSKATPGIKFTSNSGLWYTTNSIKLEVSGVTTLSLGTTTSIFDGSLTVSSSCSASSFITTSDARAKANVATVSGALNKVCAMRGVSFDRLLNGERASGVIAQEIEEIAPECVRADEDGMLSVEYAQLTAYLIEAVKDLRGQVAALSAENARV